MRKVLVFGTFDRLHKGHESFLRQSRRHGDYLIVVVTRDSNVRKAKGREPLNGERKRAAAMRKIADKVLLGERKITYDLIKKIKPDVICIGYDQRPSVSRARKILKMIKMESVSLKKMKPYRKNVYKSSKLNELAKTRL